MKLAKPKKKKKHRQNKSDHEVKILMLSLYLNVKLGAHPKTVSNHCRNTVMGLAELASVDITLTRKV